MEKPAGFAVSSKTRVKQRPTRASYDREVVHAILDEGLVCAVGFVVDGEPFVLPMVYARWDERLILHGSSKSRLTNALATGAKVCASVTLLDGLVLARSTMHHSMNYRSVAIFGVATELSDRDEKLEALARIVEHVLPRRTETARAPNELELRATSVLALPIEVASAKIRTGGPLDDEEDLDRACWAGCLPLSLVAGAPIPDPLRPPVLPVPEELLHYARGVVTLQR
jgi:nitroimidazol reductase NimA-like FMN-containing flavoprotein (pyridoxamine 5'-phosphate oxidase superfamily)